MGIALEPYKITKKDKLTSDIYLFRVEKEAGKGKGSKAKAEKLSYMPGQFYQISVPGIGEAPISVCSFSEDYIEFNIRAIGDVTDALVKLAEGEMMWLRGPYGTHYPMKDLMGKSLVVVGGGTGVAPLRGILKYVEKHRADYERVHLFFGYKCPEDIIFKNDIDIWNRIFDLHMSVDKASNDYKGRVCLVTNIVEESKLDPKNKIAFVCGGPGMIKFSIISLEKMGFTHDQIYISHERRMKCGVGMCGHCMISGTYVCKDGPVFRYDQIKKMHE
jgi:anaerobic sulfite reductase subunit B